MLRSATDRDPMMRPLRALSALFLSVILTPGAGAAEDRTLYDVEVVLFENLDVRAAGNERWQPRIVVPGFDGAATFERGPARTDAMAALPRGFRELPREQAQLGDSVERLEASERYRVIRHLLWRQPGLEAGDAMPLRFHAGDPVTVRVPEPAFAAPSLGPADPEANEQADSGATRAGDGSTDPHADGGTTPDTPFGSGMLAPRMREVSVYPLDGTIRLVVSRYVHVHVDLYYTATVDWREEAARSPEGAGTPGGTAPDGSESRRDPAASPSGTRIARGPDGRAMLTYPFVQQRRMRSGELHYLDHPVLGMLVLVTPRGEDDG